MNENEQMITRNMPVIESIIYRAVNDIRHLTGCSVKLTVSNVAINENDTVDSLIIDCCNVWDVTLEYVIKRSRKRERVMMRRSLCYLLKIKYPKLALRTIAEKLQFDGHENALYNYQEAIKHLQVEDAVFLQYFEPVKHLIS